MSFVDQFRERPLSSGQPTTLMIVTERLILRARNPDDATALFGPMSDSEIMKWWSRRPFASVEEVRANFDEARKSRDWRNWAITWKGGENGAIGFVAAGEKREGVAEIGYLLSREAQGQGIAYEAISGLIDRLFEEGHRRLFADTDPDNSRSIALLGRLGFTLEGRLRNEWHTHIGVRDSLIFGLLPGEWKPVRRYLGPNNFAPCPAS